MKRIYLILLFLTTYISNAQYTTEINSNRPSLSMGAYSVSKSIFQIEAGLGIQKDQFSNERYNNQTLVDLQLRYGAFFEQLEFVGDFKYNDTREVNFDNKNNFSGFKQIHLGAKMLIFDSYKNYVEKINVYSWKANQRYKWRRLVPTVALYLGADFKGNSYYYPENIPRTSLKAMIITQQHINNKLSFITNLIIEDASNNEFRSYAYIATLSYRLTKKWASFIENQGSFKTYTENNQSSKNNFLIRGGITYLAHKNLQLDLSGTTSISKENHKNGLMVGASWRNHKKYKEEPTENKM